MPRPARDLRLPRESKALSGLPWAVRLPNSATHSLGTLRLEPGLEILAPEHTTESTVTALWLRGPGLEVDLERALRKLPGAERFIVSAGLLYPLRSAKHGRNQDLFEPNRVPFGKMPEGEWRPLSDWILPAAGGAGWPGQFAARDDQPLVKFTLARHVAETTPSVLVLLATEWRAWAESAPLVRLKPLCFAISSDGQALIRGAPFPPLAGRLFWEDEGVAAPNGWSWQPRVEAALIRKIFRTTPQDLIVFKPESAPEIIQAAHFVRATRAAVRELPGA
jgi:hypothetical protein